MKDKPDQQGLWWSGKFPFSLTQEVSGSRPLEYKVACFTQLQYIVIKFHIKVQSTITFNSSFNMKMNIILPQITNYDIYEWW